MTEIKITHTDNCCPKYFKEPGITYKISDFVPTGMCPSAFVMCYPYALSLMYHGAFRWMESTEPNAVYGACQTGRSVFRIRRDISDDPDQKFEWKNLIQMDLTEQRDGGCEGCPHHDRVLQVGETWEFPRGDKQHHLCPAAFNNLFPAIAAARANGNSTPVRVECPDHEARITFEVSVDE